MPQSDARAACKALRAVRGEVFVPETFTAAEAQAATPSIPSGGKAGVEGSVSNESHGMAGSRG
jgi:hypothetical protein